MKSSQGHVKSMIRCWTHLGTTSVYTKEKKMSEWLGSSKSPNDIFQGLHYPLTWSNGFSAKRGKRGALVEKSGSSWHRNVVIMKISMNFFSRDKTMKTREDKRMVKLEFVLKKLPVLEFLKKNQHMHFLVHGQSSWPTFVLHLARDPKTL